MFWRLRKCRNYLLFNNKQYTAEEVITKAREDLKEWLDSKTPSQLLPSTQRKDLKTPGLNEWKSPPPEWVKCNYDAPHREGSQVSGMDWIIRNQQESY